MDNCVLRAGVMNLDGGAVVHLRGSRPIPARGPRCAVPAGWAVAFDHAIWHNAVPNLGGRGRVGTITGRATVGQRCHPAASRSTLYRDCLWLLENGSAE